MYSDTCNNGFYPVHHARMHTHKIYVATGESATLAMPELARAKTPAMCFAICAARSTKVNTMEPPEPKLKIRTYSLCLCDAVIHTHRLQFETAASMNTVAGIKQANTAASKQRRSSSHRFVLG